MNLKNIFTTTTISILFGIYSLYNLFEYVKSSEKNINKLSKKMLENNNKYLELHLKYISLKDNHDSLLLEINTLTDIISQMNQEINMLKNSGVFENIIDKDDSLVHETIICDDLCEIRSAIKNHIVETMSEPTTPANSVISSNLLVSLDSITENDLEYENVNISGRSERIPSITEINWVGLTKKFFLGF